MQRRRLILAVPALLAACTGQDAARLADTGLTAASLTNAARIESLRKTLSRIDWSNAERLALGAYYEAVVRARDEYAQAGAAIVNIASLGDLENTAPALLDVYNDAVLLRSAAWDSVLTHEDEFAVIEFARLSSWKSDAESLDQAIAEFIRNPESTEHARKAMSALDIALRAGSVLLPLLI